MTNFDEIFGEGELENLAEKFTEAGLVCSSVEDTVKPPAVKEEGILSLEFKKADSDKVAGSTSIVYSKGNWDIALMNSTSGGLYEKVVQVIPEVAETLKVETVSCTVGNEQLREYLADTFKIELASETSQLVAPVSKLREYGDWCKKGKPPEQEPEWRKSL